MRSTRSRPHRLYDDATPRERFHLMTKALARHDLADYRHLLSTAPRATIDVLHGDIREPWERLRSLTWRFRNGAAGAIAQLGLLDMLASAHLEAAADKPTAEPWAEVIVEMLTEVRSAPATVLRAWVDGYLEIGADQLGLAPETLLGFQYPDIHGPLVAYAGLLEEADPPPDLAAHVRRELMDSMEPADVALEEVS